MKKKNKVIDVKEIKDWHAYFVIFVVAVIYTYNLWSNPKLMPIGLDTISLLLDIPSYTKSIVQYGQLPLWNDLWWVGTPQYSNPLTSFYYPIATVVYSLFGGLQGIKVLIVIHVILSGLSFWFFSKMLTSNTLPRLYGSLAYMMSGLVAAKIYGGQVPALMSFAYIPLIIYFVMKSLETKENKYIILSSVFASIFILTGQKYYLAFFLMILSIITVVKFLENKDRKAFVVSGLIVGLMIGITGVTFIPSIYGSDLIKRTVDPMGGIDTIDNLLMSFFMGENLNFGTERMWGYDMKWTWETYFFIGLIPILFAGMSVFHNSKYKRMMYASILISFIYAQGSFTILGFLHYIPPFDMLRVATRILVFVTFFAIALSVLGLDWFIDDRKKKEGICNPFSIGDKIIPIVIFIVFLTGMEYIKMFTSGFNPIKEIMVVKVLVIGLILGIVFEKLTKDKTISGIVIFGLIAMVVVNGQLLSPAMPNPFIPSDIRADDEIQKIWSNVKHEPPYTVEGVGNGGLSALFGYSAVEQNVRYWNVGYGYAYKYIPKDIEIGGVGYTVIDYRLNYERLDKIDLEKPNNSLPFAFTVKDGGIKELEVRDYSPNRFVVGGRGGIVVVKNGYHHGWKVDGLKVENYQGLISVRSDGRDEYVFEFDPWDFKAGVIVSLMSIIVCVVLYRKNWKL